MADTPPIDPNKPVLWGPDGKPISLEGALVAPNALNFASVYQLPGRLYSFRWDEAMKDNPTNALAMRRSTFFRALLQERTAPTINREFQVVPDDEEDIIAGLHAAQMNRCWKATPDRIGLLTSLSEATWYGRAAAQWQWDRQRQTDMRGVVYHEPVNGDSIQFSWDNTPVVLVSSYTAGRYRATDPAAVVSMTDRGAFGIRLYKPEYRRRFAIHKHVREASDYFEGEMSGGIHGVGLRSWSYWDGWLRTEVLSWIVGYMQSTGMFDLLVFNYETGNKASYDAAVANAKAISGKMCLLVPVDRETLMRRGSVEAIAGNPAGLDALRSLMEGWGERHIERLFVGQSMSAGGGGEGGPKGGLDDSGKAEFARDTKEHLNVMDSWRLAGTLDADWLQPCYQWNFPGATRNLHMEPVIADRDVGPKIDAIFVAVEKGLEVEEGDVRKLLGVREPREGKKTLGKKEAPAPMPGNPNPTADQDKTGPDSIHADFFERLGRLEDAILYRASTPPWPGAVFDEQKHRWVNPDGSEGKGGRATSKATSPAHEQGEGLAAKAKALAYKIRTLGDKAVGVARAIGAKAHELAYRATALMLEKGLDPADVMTTPDDCGKIVNDRAMNEAIAAQLGIPLNSAVQNAVVNVLAYGIAKLKQFIRSQVAGKKPQEATGYELCPELYQDEGEQKAVKAGLWLEWVRGLLEQMGAGKDATSSDLVSEWLSAGGDMSDGE